MSPAPPASQPVASQSPVQKSSIVKLNVPPSKLSDIQSSPPNPSPVMSDGEATGGDMSDGSRNKKIKFRGIGTPTGSRAGSPAAGRPGPIAAAESPAGHSQGMAFTTFGNALDDDSEAD
jgi:transcription initiation factor TFIIF subunit alpha